MMVPSKLFPVPDDAHRPGDRPQSRCGSFKEPVSVHICYYVSYPSFATRGSAVYLCSIL